MPSTHSHTHLSRLRLAATSRASTLSPLPRLAPPPLYASARGYHSSQPACAKKNSVHRRMSRLGGVVVPDSLDETLSAHRGLNRIRKVFNPLLEQQDEKDDLLKRKIRGTENMPRSERPIPNDILAFNPIKDLKVALKLNHRAPQTNAQANTRRVPGRSNPGPLRSEPSLDDEVKTDPYHPVLRDPTTPSIDWLARNKAGQRVKQYPWLDYLGSDLAFDGKTRLNQELLAFKESMQPTRRELQVRRDLAKLMTHVLRTEIGDDEMSEAITHGYERHVSECEHPERHLRLPHSDVLLHLPMIDPVKAREGKQRGPSRLRPNMRRRGAQMLRKAEQILKQHGEGNSVLALEDLRLTETDGPQYIAARHKSTGLRVVIAAWPKPEERLTWTDAELTHNKPLGVLYPVFRTFLEAYGLFEAGNSEDFYDSRGYMPKPARGFDSYTLTVLLTAAMRLTSRPTRMPVDLADHLMDVLDFLANVNIAKVAISAEPPRVYNMDLQKPSLRLHLHDPLDSRWDLGGPLTRSRIAKRLFKAWNADVLRRVESWNVNLTKSAPPEERSVLAALAANYESFDAWRDNLIIGGMRLQGPARGISLAPSTLTNGEEKGIEA